MSEIAGMQADKTITIAARDAGQTISLDTVCNEYGAKGNYVARIVGRDSKMTFAREFLGANAVVDDAGIYELCDISRKGEKQQTYVLYDGARQVSITREAAMKIAKGIDRTDFRDAVTAEMISSLQQRIAAGAEKDQETIVKCANPVGVIASGTMIRRGELIAAMKTELALLTGESSPESPLAKFTDAELIAEITRRGLGLEVAR